MRYFTVDDCAGLRTGSQQEMRRVRRTVFGPRTRPRSTGAASAARSVAGDDEKAQKAQAASRPQVRLLCSARPPGAPGP